MIFISTPGGLTSDITNHDSNARQLDRQALINEMYGSYSMHHDYLTLAVHNANVIHARKSKKKQ